jgi:hypothetical protein
MSTEQIQRKKGKKSYSQLLEEYRGLLTKSAAVYVPELAYALRAENPQWTNEHIKNTLYNDLEGINTEKSIMVYLPQEFKDPRLVAQGKKARTAQLAQQNWVKQEKERALRLFQKVNIQVPEPPEPYEAPPTEEEEPDLDIGEPMLESYGDNVESALTLYGNINAPMRDLFRALTKKELPTSDAIDMILEYLKPSREFRKGIFYEIEHDMRISMYNAMVYTRDALNDTLRLLDEIQKQEGRLNE